MSTLNDALKGSVALAGADAALVKLERLTAVQIFEPGVIDPVLEQIELEARTEANKLDISSEMQRKAIASLAYKVARSKTFIDTQRKSLVADEKKRLARIDAEGKRIWERLESLQGEVRKPLTEWENADKARIQAHEDEMVGVRDSAKLILQNWITIPLKDMQSKLEAMESYNRNWEEFKNLGEQAVIDAQGYIREAIEKREYYDAEQIELEKFRQESEERKQKEREERAAREAKEKAEREAEFQRLQLEADKKAAEHRAEEIERRRVAEQKEAEQRAERAAEQAKRDQEAAIERERQRVADEAECERKAAEKRETNKRHVAKVNRESRDAILHHLAAAPYCVNTVAAEEIVKLIVKGEIPHITITY